MIKRRDLDNYDTPRVICPFCVNATCFTLLNLKKISNHLYDIGSCNFISHVANQLTFKYYGKFSKVSFFTLNQVHRDKSQGQTFSATGIQAD